MTEKTLQKWLHLCMTAIFLCSMIVLSKEAALYTISTNAQKQPFTVVIDSGHGGDDPGKIAADGTLEKDLNLSIAKKLQTYLEAADVHVVMTRTTDSGLYDEHTSGKKAQDMKNRVAIMEECAADVVVSIHQNSYSDSSIHGAQVFYYTTSNSGKCLAQLLQNILIQELDPDNHRQAKANDSYYLLKKTSHPIVIVECGFLSNPEETALLCSQSYQDQIAWVLHMGILQYLHTANKT